MSPIVSKVSVASFAVAITLLFSFSFADADAGDADSRSSPFSSLETSQQSKPDVLSDGTAWHCIVREIYCYDASDSIFVRDTRILWQVFADPPNSGDLVDGAIERKYGNKQCEDIDDFNDFPVGSSKKCVQLHDAVFDWDTSVSWLTLVIVLATIVGASIFLCCCCVCAGAAAGSNARYRRVN